MNSSQKTRLTAFTNFSILSIAFVWLFEASAVSPILGNLAESFPDTSTFKLQLVSTIPFLSSIIFSIISGLLAKKYDKKKIIIFGLLIYGITGILPGFASSIDQILLCRFFTGIGVGLVLPLPNVIISEFYEGEKRKRMLGLATSVSNLANVMNSVLIGFLLTLGWRYCFIAFILVLIVAMINLFGLPQCPPAKKEDDIKTNIVHRTSAKIPAAVFVLAIFMILNWAVFQLNILNMAFFVLSEKLGQPWMIGLAIAVPGLGSMISGALFPELHRNLKKFLVFFGLIIYTLGFFTLSNVHTFAILLIANFIIGFGSGILVPYILYLTSVKTDDSQKDLSFGIVTSCIHLGIFASPFLQLIITSFIKTDALRSLYTTATITLSAATVVALFLSFAPSRLTSDAESELN